MTAFPAFTPMKIKLAAMAALSLLLAACGSLVGLPSSDPAARYTLRPPTDLESPRLPVVIMVAEPEAPAALDSERIALKPNELEVQYYANARWADRAPRLMQRHLIAALTGAVTDAGTETMPLPADYRVETSLLAMEAIYTGGKTPTIRVTLDAKLFARTPLALLDRRRFTAEVPARQDKLAVIMAAFDEAVANVTSDFTAWVLAASDSAQ